VAEIRDFTGWGESGKVILQVRIAVFWVLWKTFSGKDGSDAWKKIGPYAYAYLHYNSAALSFLRATDYCDRCIGDM